MTKAEDVAAAWAAVDAATTDLGSRVTALITEINRTASDGLTGPQTEAVLANLTGLAASLNSMGHNASNPVPPAPTPVPLPGPFADGTNPDGARNPDGTQRNPDGSYRHADGSLRNADGTRR